MTLLGISLVLSCVLGGAISLMARNETVRLAGFGLFVVAFLGGAMLGTVFYTHNFPAGPMYVPGSGW